MSRSAQQTTPHRQLDTTILSYNLYYFIVLLLISFHIFAVFSVDIKILSDTNLSHRRMPH